MISAVKNTLLGAVVVFSLFAAGGLSSPCLAQTNEDIADSVETTCPNSQLISGKMLTDICWKCVFPIRISGVTISGSVNADNRPSGASDRKLCICTDGLGVPHPGVVTSFWQPAYVFEFMRTPGCLSSLNGVTLPLNQANRGTTGHDNANGVDGTPGFRHYHMYAFPVMIMLDIFVPCVNEMAREAAGGVPASFRSRRLFELLPGHGELLQEPRYQESGYYRVMLVLDYVSGMSDSYAVSLYQKLKGISI